jgi:hypothetical protein
MFRSITIVTLLLLNISSAWSLGTEGFGNAPLRDANYSTWPKVMPVINDSHRVYHSWVNGNEYFYFAGDTAALNSALNAFAEIKAERLTVVLRQGPGQVSSFRREKSLSYNWNVHLPSRTNRLRTASCWQEKSERGHGAIQIATKCKDATALAGCSRVRIGHPSGPGAVHPRGQLFDN